MQKVLFLLASLVFTGCASNDPPPRSHRVIQSSAVPQPSPAAEPANPPISTDSGSPAPSGIGSGSASNNTTNSFGAIPGSAVRLPGPEKPSDTPTADPNRGNIDNTSSASSIAREVQAGDEAGPIRRELPGTAPRPGSQGLGTPPDNPSLRDTNAPPANTRLNPPPPGSTPQGSGVLDPDSNAPTKAPGDRP